MALGKASIVLERVYGKRHSMRLHLLRSVAQNITAFSAWESDGREHGDFFFLLLLFFFVHTIIFWTTVTDSNTFETSAEHWKLNRY